MAYRKDEYDAYIAKINALHSTAIAEHDCKHMEDIRHVRTDMEMKMQGVKDICNNELERAKEEYKYMKQDLTDKYVLL